MKRKRRPQPYEEQVYALSVLQSDELAQAREELERQLTSGCDIAGACWEYERKCIAIGQKYTQKIADAMYRRTRRAA